MENEEVILVEDDCCVDDILRKYGIGTSKTGDQGGKPRTKTTKLKVFELSDSDTDESPLSQPKIPASDYFDKIINKGPSKPEKSPNKSLENAEKTKKQELQQKKNEALKNKEIKKLISMANKNLKPDECIKFITVNIDTAITQSNNTLLNALKELGCNYAFKSQLIPNTITWTRRTESHFIDDATSTLKTSTNTQEESNLLIILTTDELINLLKEKDNKLLVHIQSIQSIYGNKKISMAIIGLEKHFKHIKQQKRRSKNSQVTGGSPTRQEIMTALTELQLFCNCCYRDVENDAELSVLICQFTKAIAQRPFKLQQQEKNNLTNWYMKGDNKDCVKVDKKGNGLKRLWQQQLTAFPLARLETAESIIDKYPTLNSLMEAYDLETLSGREELLADIAIRRNAGPMTASRRIGPELSKKVCVFYNSIDGDAILG